MTNVRDDTRTKHKSPAVASALVRRVSPAAAAQSGDLASLTGRVPPSSISDNGGPRKANGSVFRDQHVHFVGVGGSGMSGLAELVILQGGTVSGSDLTDSTVLARLAGRGATIHLQQLANQITPETQWVVHSAAIPKDNPELSEARRRKIPTLKYAQMLGRLMSGTHGVAVAGTHGKSTTTAMLSYMLKLAGLDPSYVVGAHVQQLDGSSHAGSGDDFVAEACEYDRSFLNLEPRCAAILNIEEDHLDYYRDLEEIIEAFAEFVSRVPADGMVVACTEKEAVAKAVKRVSARVVSFGLDGSCEWQAVNLAPERGRFYFDAVHKGKKLGRFRLNLPGLHNVYNALAVIAIATERGVDRETIGGALSTFEGAARRLSVKCQLHGVTVVDDYAHHPTEIQVTLKAARDYFNPQRLIVVFQPHQHSRTRFLLNDFARCFTSADHIILPEIFFMRDSEESRKTVSASDLTNAITAHGGDARFIPSFKKIVGHLQKTASPGDLIITMGAGDVWEIADELVRRLGRNH